MSNTLYTPIPIDNSYTPISQDYPYILHTIIRL